MISKVVDDVLFGPEDKLCIDTLRALSVDMSFIANSGHPGAPMGLAPLIHVLFQNMNLSRQNDKGWINRDRFVLSNGHACALLYSMLHLYGFDLSLDDLKAFRKLDSRTPGHPESFETPGIEVTTGPLGQGFANAVGLAIAERHMAATFNRPNHELFDHKTFVVFGDGCAMEGVAAEAASLAGHLRLNNLIAIYDDNHICIDGDINMTFTEDVMKRFEAYGWHTEHVKDGNTDLEGIDAAIKRALLVTDKPSLIKVTTTIGYGSLLAGTAACHGSPLKYEDLVQFRKRFDIPAEPFTVPKKVYRKYDSYAESGLEAEREWTKSYASYQQSYPELYEQLSRRLEGNLPTDWQRLLPSYSTSDPALATRQTSQIVLSAMQELLSELMSGSADLTPSNNTRWKSASDFQAPETRIGTYEGRYLRWGVREHAMGAAMNGIAAYGANLIPAAGTFLNFVSYAAGAVRLSALSRQRVIWVATHDSVALGEDGPTHQPIEALAHFRAMPNINVWLPADGNETSAAYMSALSCKDTPSIIALSRQPLPQLAENSIEIASRGGYICRDVEDGDLPQLTIVATGSEVSICLEAADILEKDGQKSVRVVSMPCQEIFDRQDQLYRQSVLQRGSVILSVEALSTQGWQKYSHEQFGIDTFGASGPAKQVLEKFGMTSRGVVQQALKTISFYNGRKEIYSPIERALH